MYKTCDQTKSTVAKKVVVSAKQRRNKFVHKKQEIYFEENLVCLLILNKYHKAVTKPYI